MDEPVAWLADAWAGRRQWRILDTDFGQGADFLACWRAWKGDARRPAMLHFVAFCASPPPSEELLRAATTPQLHPLAAELAGQWFGLTAGMHRFAFDGDRVLLTLFVGQVRDALRQQTFRADCVFLGRPDGTDNPTMGKALARHCRRGARLVAQVASDSLRRSLAEAGFAVQAGGDSSGGLQAVFDPAWEPRGPRPDADAEPGDCAVIGGGLAGAAVAASLARRGWRVTVLDAAQEPAAGASGLPVGLLAPHYSPDDSLLSRLSRSGVRMTMSQARMLLREGEDWAATGALEVRDLEDRRPLLADAAMQPWSREAEARHKELGRVPAGAAAIWHQQAAWIKPAALVRAWLATPGIAWQGGSRVRRIERADDCWRLEDANGATLAQATLVIAAAATGCVELLGGRIPVHPVRGQVTWSVQGSEGLPPFPLHGDGHFIAGVPTAHGPAWFCGSTFTPNESSLQARAEDQRFNLDRLARLAPPVAHAVSHAIASHALQDWTGVRCASIDRRPLLGEIEPGLWISTAMGSRGLTFAALCGELLAARVHGEPLPLERRVAQALDATR
ncbi:FAD-dependent 5-carboxymethylaminomethyl-2-thiouridine(34) oxidoreductase MnmC [Caenimonas aquaedulcis]|uniref:FAD-dependent 5-carboxymethylaminomethyl-2-thiouridine(34) oxidoreductase MnmC n=1 Tax=Caenimonas aquaedulcis TaxID=2793270 RepID=A0A931H212_9BURK|nr:FAD-dependent 5-carboxymethylaminomethyl-2-thiouridine(34) oxidoreductase MnmC [Caenimonas aquaedulcis]MBG9387111.1 FAD-dependent 5-carboxymethylaminomethyl-2-thiouridine(34) oxidoreductase MnmC [Caenimonas aquaedulcis]